MIFNTLYFLTYCLLIYNINNLKQSKLLSHNYLHNVKQPYLLSNNNKLNNLNIISNNNKLNNLNIISNINYYFQNIENIYFIKKINKNYKNINYKNILNYEDILKTKVFIHIERITPIVPIYHIGISFKNYYTTIRYDIGEVNKINFLRKIPKKNEKYTIFWGYTPKTIKEIIEYENKIKSTYIIGINDCRHHTQKLANWTTNNPTPIWKIYNIL